jgi:hypothetical protein
MLIDIDNDIKNKWEGFDYVLTINWKKIRKYGSVNYNNCFQLALLELQSSPVLLSLKITSLGHISKTLNIGYR